MGREVRFVLLVSLLAGAIAGSSPSVAAAQFCEDCWRCPVRFNPTIYECCEASTDGQKTCGLRHPDCERRVVAANNCYSSSTSCQGTSHSCRAGGGGSGGGGGGGACSIPYGNLCPAECFSCTYYYY